MCIEHSSTANPDKSGLTHVFGIYFESQYIVRAETLDTLNACGYNLITLKVSKKDMVIVQMMSQKDSSF